MTKYLLFIIILLVSSLIISVKSYQDIRQDRKRLSDNQQTLLSDVQYYRTKDSLSAASVERLTLTKHEFEQYCLDLEEEIRNLNIRLKRLQSVSQTAVTTERTLETIVRDTIIRTDTIRTFRFSDPWLTFDGEILNNRFAGHIESRDTLVQVIHRVPRRFWFIRWGTKAIRQDMFCKNPYNQIIYTQYIELKK